MLISFEGIDGCGKSTQIELLKNHFENKGLTTLTLREPGGTNFSEQIREILLHSKSTINSISELFLFESARADLMEKVIKPALEQNTIVILDRFFDSTTAYQGFGRKLDIEIIKNLNKLATSEIVPDITFYLHVELETSLKRSKDKDKDRIESSGNGFFEDVIKGFCSLVENEPERIKKIDAEGSIEDTHKIIVDLLEKKKIM